MHGIPFRSRSSMTRTKIVTFSLLPTLFLLGAGELGLRVWAYYFRTSYERFNYTSGRLELVPNIRFISPQGDEFLINAKGFVGPDFQEHKPKGTYRIIALGDSNTFGAGFWRNTYPGMLQELLMRSSSRTRFEVINAGIEGYNSEYALARLKTDLLRYEPDMITIYVGWNDLMKINPNRVSATGKYKWLATLLERSYLLKAYNKLIFFYVRPLILQPQVAANQTESHAFDQFVPLAFRDNLDSMITALRPRGTKPVLITLPTVVTPLMSLDELKRQRVFFPYYAGTYSVEKFLSLHRAYNNTIREVARNHGVLLVDLDAIFNTHDKTDLFWDTMHPSVKGHTLIARSIFDNLRLAIEPHP